MTLYGFILVKPVCAAVAAAAAAGVGEENVAGLGTLWRRAMNH